MLRDVFTGIYKKVPVGTIAAIIGTLLYVLSPIDLIPDFLPGGFLCRNCCLVYIVYKI
jgi:uncharacterized membrane protein YkvA (DUF1232 family)